MFNNTKIALSAVVVLSTAFPAVGRNQTSLPHPCSSSNLQHGPRHHLPAVWWSILQW
jgi:hypothetical protein